MTDSNIDYQATYVLVSRKQPIIRKPQAQRRARPIDASFSAQLFF